MTDNISALGFNGAYLDSTLDSYHLGNGYRAYNPSIMAFTAPDDMSPFGHGGINPYVYVSGDPINNTDPTGHFGFLGAIIGIINMVLPLQVPTSLSVAGIEEAAIGTGINLGVDLATDGLGALATPAVETMDAALKTMLDDAILESQKEIEDEKMHNILNGVLDLQEEREIVEPPLQHTSPQFNESAHHDAPGPARITHYNPHRGGSAKDNALTARIEGEYIKAKVSTDRRQIWHDKPNTHEFWAPTVAAKQAITGDIKYNSIFNVLTNRRWEYVGKLDDVFHPEPIKSYYNERLWGAQPYHAAVFKRPL